MRFHNVERIVFTPFYSSENPNGSRLNYALIEWFIGNVACHMARLTGLELRELIHVTVTIYSALTACMGLRQLHLPVHGLEVPAAAALQPLTALHNLEVRRLIASCIQC